MNTVDMMELIRARHSVRSYQERNLSPDAKVQVLAELERINAQTGLHIQLIEETEGVFGGLLSRVIGWKHVPCYLALVGPDGPTLEEQCGYYGEQLVLFLQSIGLNTCWVGMFKASAVKADIRPGEKLVITIVLGYGTDSGKARKSKAPEQVTDVQEMPDWFRAGVECALLAPTAINQQKFRISLDGDTPSVTAAGNGPFLKVDLGIVKYHFEVGSGKKLP